MAYENADAELNRAYQEVVAGLENAAATAALRKAQRAWMAFRDAHCESDVFDSRDGTGYGAFLSACLQTVTEQRTQYLQTRYLHTGSERPR